MFNMSNMPNMSSVVSYISSLPICSYPQPTPRHANNLDPDVRGRLSSSVAALSRKPLNRRTCCMRPPCSLVRQTLPARSGTFTSSMAKFAFKTSLGLRISSSRLPCSTACRMAWRLDDMSIRLWCIPPLARVGLGDTAGHLWPGRHNLRIGACGSHRVHPSQRPCECGVVPAPRGAGGYCLGACSA